MGDVTSSESDNVSTAWSARCRGLSPGVSGLHSRRGLEGSVLCCLGRGA